MVVRAGSCCEMVGKATPAHYQGHEERCCCDHDQEYDEGEERTDRSPWTELTWTKGAKSNHSPWTWTVDCNP